MCIFNGKVYCRFKDDAPILLKVEESYRSHQKKMLQCSKTLGWL